METKQVITNILVLVFVAGLIWFAVNKSGNRKSTASSEVPAAVDEQIAIQEPSHVPSGTNVAAVYGLLSWPHQGAR